MNELINRKILVLYTGGTIGMTRKTPDDPWTPGPIKKLIEHIPQLHTLPYDIVWQEYFIGGKPIDSSNADYPLYNGLAKRIAREYKKYDGFVVIYGTDTMAPSAAALSYLLEGLGKPVVFTGSMIPASEQRSDGQQNVIDAITVAGESGKTIPSLREVLIVFHGKILRGVAAEKYSSHGFDSFDVPERESFGKIMPDGKILLDPAQLSDNTKHGESIQINTLKIDSVPVHIDTYPMDRDVFRRIVQASLEVNPPGVLVTGMKLNDQSYMVPILREMIPENIPVFYATGNKSPEPSWAQLDGLNNFQQAMIKAAYVLSRTDDPQTAKALYSANIRGEGKGPIVSESEILEKNELKQEQRSEFDTR